ncbi:MAG: SCP2 sterol-binding domain-containing protein [Lachnospiraceae bacterium]|nr:SCP2 sterol-binding domain-containing protein [Lachnospiraceae bacterium]
MTYEQLVEKVKKLTEGMRVSKDIGHIAYQFNVEGEAEGAFYIELDNGKVNVEPYEYYDRNVLIITSAEMIIKVLEGKTNPMEAYANGELRAYGEVEQLKLLPTCSESKNKRKKK